ncbi:penicillin-binding protein 2 [Candidatus Saccharibacteria bacterium]|nr:penicillin-binding protein 2 [Candidatus Saccharibacteria bacterium]MCB9834797.1 penicillin-binding protein 2 [Candidatus Nomurabacteria bacterium]
MTSRYNLSQRLNSWVAVVFVIFAIVVYRLIVIQVFDNQKYLQAAANQQTKRQTIIAKRGRILLKEGDQSFAIAQNQAVKSLRADPKIVKDIDLLADKLSSIIGIPRTELVDKLTYSGNRYVAIADNLTLNQVEEIESLGVEGLILEDSESRYYGESELFAGISGFVNSDGVGQYGVEQYWDDVLAGTPGLVKAVKDNQGISLASRDNILVDPVDGGDIYLTLDRNIQAWSYDILAKYMDKHQAFEGQIVVMDPMTGKLNAMVNLPSYDPNKYGSVDSESAYINPIVSDIYEPGSVFKPLTMAAGLESGQVTANSSYFDSGSVTIDGQVINNAEHKSYGTVAMVDVLRNSLNTGVVWILQHLGGAYPEINQQAKVVFRDFISKVGFGKKTDIDIFGEFSEQLGIVKSVDSSNFDYANMTFGQGISVTSLQMIRALAIFANGGNLVRPYLVGSVSYPDGKEKIFEPKIEQAVITPEVSSQVKAMMEAVVSPSASGYNAVVPGYRIGGKTGTAQVPDGQGGYRTDQYNHTFIGFQSDPNSKFIILVRLRVPASQGYSASTSAKAFAELAKKLFDYYQIAPTS